MRKRRNKPQARLNVEALQARYALNTEFECLVIIDDTGTGHYQSCDDYGFGAPVPGEHSEVSFEETPTDHNVIYPEGEIVDVELMTEVVTEELVDVESVTKETPAEETVIEPEGEIMYVEMMMEGGGTEEEVPPVEGEIGEPLILVIDEELPPEEYSEHYESLPPEEEVYDDPEAVHRSDETPAADGDPEVYMYTMTGGDDELLAATSGLAPEDDAAAPDAALVPLLLTEEEIATTTAAAPAWETPEATPSVEPIAIEVATEEATPLATTPAAETTAIDDVFAAFAI